MIKLVHLRIHPPIACPSASHVDRVGALSLSLSFSSRSFTHFCVVARSLVHPPTSSRSLLTGEKRTEGSDRVRSGHIYQMLLATLRVLEPQECLTSLCHTPVTKTRSISHCTVVKCYENGHVGLRWCFVTRKVRKAWSGAWCKATITTWLFFKDFAVSSKCTNFLTTNEKGLKWD